MRDERLLITDAETYQVLIETGRIARRPKLHRHVVVVIYFAVRIRAIDLEHRGITVGDGAAFDRFVLGGPFAKTFQCPLDRIVRDRGGRATKRDAREIARIERWNGFNRRG